MDILKTNILVKASLIFMVGILLFIPAFMISNMIEERENRQNEATWEVSNKWSKEQTITGPIVTIPYYKYTREYSGHDSVVKTVRSTKYMHFLPDDLKIETNIDPETRNRGIFEIVVYNSVIKLSGVFNDIDIKNSDVQKENILFDKAFISIGISDLRGVEKQVDLTWNAEKYSFNSGTVTNNVIETGINTQVNINPDDSISYKFSLSLDLKGSQSLYFVPVGKNTDVVALSNWSNPSFDGAFLPDNG